MYLEDNINVQFLLAKINCNTLKSSMASIDELTQKSSKRDGQGKMYRFNQVLIVNRSFNLHVLNYYTLKTMKEYLANYLAKISV